MTRKAASVSLRSFWIAPAASSGCPRAVDEDDVREPPGDRLRLAALKRHGFGERGRIPARGGNDSSGSVAVSPPTKPSGPCRSSVASHASGRRARRLATTRSGGSVRLTSTVTSPARGRMPRSTSPGGACGFRRVPGIGSPPCRKPSSSPTRPPRPPPSTSRRVIVKALSSDLRLEVVDTAAPGHATAVASEAVRSGYGLVVASVAMGTLNEWRTAWSAATPPWRSWPGGNANVVCRNTRPSPPTSSAPPERLLNSLRGHTTRRISVGRDRRTLLPRLLWPWAPPA